MSSELIVVMLRVVVYPALCGGLCAIVSFAVGKLTAQKLSNSRKWACPAFFLYEGFEGAGIAARKEARAC